MTTGSLRLVVLAGCLTALGAAGCGGGNSFVSQANSICKATNDKINSLPKPTTAAALTAEINQIVPLVQEGTVKLQALKPPTNQTSTFQQWIALLQQELANDEQAQNAARAGDLPQAESLVNTQNPPLIAQSHAKARVLGLTECTK